MRFSFARADGKLEAAAAQAGRGASTGTPAEAAAHGEVVLLAVPWGSVEEALAQAGSLQGKLLLTCITPLKPDLSDLAIGHTTSGAEEIAKRAPGARVVEAFNSAFAEILASDVRTFEGKRGSIFLAGDDADAKVSVEQLVRDAGFEPVDTGPLTSARYIEPAGMLMVKLGYVQGRGPEIGLRLVARDA